jgi:hypothetical protein
MRRKSMLFVGDHARMYFGSASKVDEIDNDVHLLRYQREDIITNEPAKALFDSVSLSFNETYSLDGLHKDLIKNKQHINFKCDVLIGDPTELLFQAFVKELFLIEDLPFFPIVLFLYPVGMNSLDARKEISALILTMKANHVLTYVIRNPQDTFLKIMTALNELDSLSDFILIENNIQNLDYLFGHDAEILN